MTRHFTKLIVVLLILFSHQQSAFCQSNDSIISIFKTRYAETKKNISTYDTVSVEIENESTEDAVAIGYFEKDVLKMIEITWFGESGKKKTEYYYHNRRLYFVMRSDFEYNRPFYYDEELAKENNDTITYEPEKTKMTEDRLYFQNRKLIRWLDNNMNEVSRKSAKYSKMEKKTIRAAIALEKRMKK